jgi:hypothetical protein
MQVAACRWTSFALNGEGAPVIVHRLRRRRYVVHHLQCHGRRFFLMVRTGCGTSSSCEALRFRSERVPSGGSSGRMSSLKIECPPGSTPRCDGSKSLASLGTDDSLRRVSDSMGSFSSWLSSCKSFCMQALHRQCFASIKISGHCIEQGLEGPLYRHPGLAC